MGITFATGGDGPLKCMGNARTDQEMYQFFLFSFKDLLAAEIIKKLFRMAIRFSKNPPRSSAHIRELASILPGVAASANVLRPEVTGPTKHSSNTHDAYNFFHPSSC